MSYPEAMGSAKSARRFLISGRVQGVGYRAFAERTAREIGVTGWVQNLGDGRVEAHANGTAAELDRFEARLMAGPRWCEVRAVEAVKAEVTDAVRFLIR
jgi:acylphosphatase